MANPRGKERIGWLVAGNVFVPVPGHSSSSSSSSLLWHRCALKVSLPLGGW